MKLTCNTVSDSISSPDLDPAQTAALQATLSSALFRNDPVQTVARVLLDAATTTRDRPPVTTDQDGTPVENASG